MNRLSFWMVSAGLVTALAVGCSSDDDSAPPGGSAGTPSTGGTSGTGGKGGGAGTSGTSGLAGGGGQTSESIEIEGTWVNLDFDETDIIDDTSWSSAFGSSPASVYVIDEFSNSERYAIRKSPFDGTFDRVVWTKPENGEFYYCTVIFGCETADLTESGVSADGAAGAAGAGGAGGVPQCQLSPVSDADPDHGGCGAFPWTKLTHQ
jgi:hypothetical protein